MSNPPVKKTHSQKRSSFRWLRQQSTVAKPWIMSTVLLGIISGLLIIFQANLLAKIIDRVYLHHQTIHQLSPLLWILLIITLCRFGCVWLKEITGFKAADCVKKKVRFSLFNALLQKNPDTLSKQKTGALTTTLIERIETLHNFFSEYLPQMTIVIVLPIIILIFVFQNNWIAGLILLITAPLIPLFMALIGMGVESLNQKNFQSLARLGAHFLDLLQGLSTLTLFNQAQAQTNTIASRSDAYRVKTMHVLRIAFLSSAVLELFSTVAIAMIAIYLGLGLLHLIHVGFNPAGITLESALFILLLAPEFFMPLRQLGSFYHARAEAIAAATQLQKIDQQAPILETPKTNIESLNPNFILTLNDITFGYPNKTPIFKNFNLTIAAGETIALAGPSGAGKSTLLKLIAQLQKPQSGNILLDDLDLGLVDTESFRQYLVLLTQRPYLFHDTIAANIALSKPNASQAMIENAAYAADVLSFTQHLPQGLNTPIGEQQLGLSGGQAQRVALARAYLKDTPIVLLDEPTAHLDTNNKAFLINIIKQWHGKKTLIIATHDQAILDMVDRIVRIP